MNMLLTEWIRSFDQCFLAMVCDWQILLLAGSYCRRLCLWFNCFFSTSPNFVTEQMTILTDGLCNIQMSCSTANVRNGWSSSSDLKLCNANLLRKIQIWTKRIYGDKVPNSWLMVCDLASILEFFEIMQTEKVEIDRKSSNFRQDSLRSIIYLRWIWLRNWSTRRDRCWNNGNIWGPRSCCLWIRTHRSAKKWRRFLILLHLRRNSRRPACWCHQSLHTTCNPWSNEWRNRRSFFFNRSENFQHKIF